MSDQLHAAVQTHVEAEAVKLGLGLTPSQIAALVQLVIATIAQVLVIFKQPEPPAGA